MLVPYFKFLELGLIGLIVDGLKDILEETVVLLQNGVFGREVQRVLFHDSGGETAVGELLNALLGVIHGQPAAPALWVIEHLHSFFFPPHFRV